MKITLELAVHALGAQGSAGSYRAPCPVCQFKDVGNPALALSTGKSGGLLLFCHKSGCDYAEILSEIRAYSGGDPSDFPALPNLPSGEDRNFDEMLKSLDAKAAWDRSIPITNTPAEAYLRSRAIDCVLPDTLRYLPPENTSLCPSGHHEMVGLVEGGAGFAIQRTLLTASGTKALDDQSKRQFGRTKGGAVKLSQGNDALVVAEGIETALSMLCGLIDGDNAVWAALSTSGMKALQLPEQAGRLIIAVDGDDGGRTAASKLAERADSLGWKVQLAEAPDGTDFNDTLTRKEFSNVKNYNQRLSF